MPCRPKVICTLGNTPLRALSGNFRAGITRMRGKPFDWRGYTVIPPSIQLSSSQRCRQKAMLGRFEIRAQLPEPRTTKAR